MERGRLLTTEESEALRPMNAVAAERHVPNEPVRYARAEEQVQARFAVQEEPLMQAVRAEAPLQARQAVQAVQLVHAVRAEAPLQARQAVQAEQLVRAVHVEAALHQAEQPVHATREATVRRVEETE
jgi:hypothetical protein